MLDGPGPGRRVSAFASIVRSRGLSSGHGAATRGGREPAGPALKEVTGSVHDLRQFGDWAIAYVVDDEFVQHRITGNNVAQLKEGQEYRLSGSPKRHPKYGDSLEILSYEPFVQLNEEAIIRFIAANFKGIGEKSARKLVEATKEADPDHGLEQLRERLLKEPWSVDFTGISRKAAFAGQEDDRNQAIAAFIQRDLALRLTKVPAGVLRRLALYLATQVAGGASQAEAGATPPVTQAWEIFARNPYEPIKAVAGYGFLLADQVGRFLRIPPEAPARLAALVAYALDDRCEAEGHAYLLQGHVTGAIRRVDPAVDANVALAKAIEDGAVVVDRSRGDMRIYPAKLLDAEKRLAARISDLCQPVTPLAKDRGDALRKRIDAAARSLGGAFKDGLDPSQAKAIERILTARVRLHTITAGPGSGKTAVMEALSAALPRRRFVFCAPTGKGAKVLSNRVASRGFSATTIHSMLGGDPDGGFRVNSTNPLEGDVLVIDEGSMPPLRLAAAMLEGVNEDMHVVVLGDVDQLPSIGPGRFLADLLEIDAVDHNRLDTVHRNGGAILETIDEVRSGKLRPRSRMEVSFSEGLPSAATGFHSLAAEYLAAVQRSGYEGTALLMSRRKGDAEEPGWNTTFVNAALRELCNPDAAKIPGSTLRVGDRIIVKANMTLAVGEAGEVRVVNGDTGRILGFVPSADRRKGSPESIQLKLDDERVIDFPGDSTSVLQLGYALTVHAAQGSEYREVIAVITPGVPTFVNRNMLYTGLSRARASLSVHGEPKDLVRIASTPMPGRNSGLVERVRALLHDLDREDSVDDGACETGPGDLGSAELEAERHGRSRGRH